MKMKSRGGDFKSPGTPDSPTTKKKRRTSTAPATPPAMQGLAAQNSPMPELVPPPPITGYGDTIVASNPFDDMPSPSSRGHPGGGQGGQGPCGPGPSGPPMGGMGPRGPPPFPPGGGPPHPHHHHHGHGGPPGGMGGGMGMGGPHHGPPPGMMRMGCPPGGHGPPQGMPQGQGQGGPMGGPGGGPMPPQWNNGPSKPPIPPIQSGKMYPPDQPMIFNPQNPNAPPIYPCGLCHKEVHDNDQAIPCESGCHFWFHRVCTGLTEAAFYYLNHEVYAEWVCDNCLSNKNIPLVKFKP